MVVKCKNHGTCMTVYPRGYVKYSRTKVCPTEANTEPKRKAEAWKDTIFEPSMSSEWCTRYAYTGDACWQTWRRRLGLAGRVLGLTGPSVVGEQVAAILEVPLHHHQDARALFASGGIGAEQAAIRNVLAEIQVTGRLWRQVLRAGHVTGTWGRAWEWTDDGRLEPLFRPSERSPWRSPGRGATTDP